jgi:hypothetical protein
MKQQINYALVLLFLLVAWLFTNSGISLYKMLIQEKDITLRYDIESGPLGTLLYDRVTGETWKYHAVSGEEGWSRFYYRDVLLPGPEGVSDAYALTPAEMLRKQKASVQRWLKQYQKGIKDIGNVVEMRSLSGLIEEEKEKKSAPEK